MTPRFKIRDILVATSLVALLLGLYAPELRSTDRNARVVFVASGVILSVSLVGLSPAWVVLLRLRRRSREGRPIGFAQYVAVMAAYLLGLGIIVAIGLAVRWLVVRWRSG